MDLLEAYKLKPLMKGDKLAKAFDTKSVKWRSEALERIVAWQLRNPDKSDPELAIEEEKENIRALIKKYSA